CAGDLTIEAHAFDLVGGESLFDVAVRDLGSASAATSAPNGRVVLCVPPGDQVDLEAELDDGALRVDRVAAAAVGRLRVHGQAHPLGLLAAADLAALAADLGVAPPDAGSTWVVVHGLGSDGAPLVGAEVTLDVAHG